MSISATSQVVISRNGTYIVGRVMDINLQVGDMIPVFNYGSGSVVFDTISSITSVTTSPSDNVVDMTVNNGSVVTGTSALSVMIYQGNSFTFPPLGSITDGTLCPVSLMLPNRLGQQITGGLSINVQMIQNIHDPMIQIPVTTNTWGPLVIQYSDIQKFVLATSDQADKDALQTISTANVQFSPVMSVSSSASQAVNAVKIHTTSGLPFMLSSGIFVQCT